MQTRIAISLCLITLLSIWHLEAAQTDIKAQIANLQDESGYVGPIVITPATQKALAHGHLQTTGPDSQQMDEEQALTTEEIQNEIHRLYKIRAAYIDKKYVQDGLYTFCSAGCCAAIGGCIDNYCESNPVFLSIGALAGAASGIAHHIYYTTSTTQRTVARYDAIINKMQEKLEKQKAD